MKRETKKYLKNITHVEMLKPNQFIIYTKDAQIFQSYSSIIAIKPYGKRPIIGKHFDYSNTTMKYLKQFLNNSGVLETRKKIDEGEYVYDKDLVQHLLTVYRLVVRYTASLCTGNKTRQPKQKDNIMEKITKKAFMELHKSNKLNRLGVSDKSWKETEKLITDKEGFIAAYNSAVENNTSRLDLYKHDTCYIVELHGKTLYIVEGIYPRANGVDILYDTLIYKEL